MKKIGFGLMIIFLSSLFTGNAFAQHHKTKNIIIVTVDGYRWQEIFRGADSTLLFGHRFNTRDSAWRVHTYWSSDMQERREKLMPFFWNVIAKHGQLYGNRDIGNDVNVRNTYWFSYPGYSEILTGYFDPRINSNNYPNNPDINVLEFINKQPRFHGKVVAFASWDALARIINRDRNHLLVNIYNEDVTGPHLTELQKEANHWQHWIPPVFGSGERLDGATYAITKAYIMANHPRVIYLDFGDTDDFGHEGKYDYYLGAAHYVDAMIGDLWNYLQHDPFYKNNTTILISPDHGRGIGNQWTSHGSSIPHAGETWLAVMGPDTPPLGEVKAKEQIYQDQYAQSIARFLGLHFTANHPVGKPIESVMNK